GLLVIGPSWVLFTVMGQRYFPVRWQGIDAQRGAMLGMSLLMASRGLGALLGPLLFASIAGHRESRLRMGILFGFLADTAGYVGLSLAPNVWAASVSVVLAHCGGSAIWVFSTTLLQWHTDDRFRGRVFAADLGLSDVDHRSGCVLVRTPPGLGHFRAPGCDLYGTDYAGSRRVVGAVDAIESEVSFDARQQR